MQKAVKLRVAGLLILLFVAISSGLYFARSSQAQSGDSFEVKADGQLKRAYQLFRRQTGKTLSANTERERRALRHQLAIEDRDGSTLIGVNIRLRENSEEALAAAEAELRSAGFRLGARIGNIVTVEATADELPRLAEFAAIEKLHAALMQYNEAEERLELRIRNKAELVRARRLMNDLVNQAVKAPEARSTYNVTGRGVLIGIIDSGIDIKHGDFRNANGTTRVRFFWDLSNTEIIGTRGPNNLGRVFTEAELNQSLQNSGTVPLETSGHGSHVGGIASGNGLGAGTGGTADSYRGIAPEAELIVVKASRPGSSGYRSDDLINAIAWVRDRAAELNNSYLVINMSIGGQRGNRDGTDPQEIAIDNFVGSGDNRQYCTSAGNTGTIRNHAGGVIAQGAEITLPFNMTTSSIGLQLIYNGNDTITATLIKPDGTTTIGPVGVNSSNTSDLNVELFQQPSGTSNNARQIYVECTDAGCNSGQWKLVLKGETIKNGRYDVWAMDQGDTRFDATVADNINETGHPKGVKRAMVVANYVTKTAWMNFENGNFTNTSQGPVGQIALSSSGGPSRDARLKPNIAAPGTYVFSTLSANISSAPANSRIGPGSKHYATLGTSMASPVVTGTIALMLQAAKDRGRTLAPDQIRRILQGTVINDTNTGASVSYKYGYGKVNALEAVKAVVDNTYSTEFVSVNAAGFMVDNVTTTNSIMAGFGPNLAAGTVGASGLPLPTSLGDVQVRLTGKNGQQQLATLFFVSASQINYLIPGNVAAGVAQTEVIRSGNVVARGTVSVTTAWPGLFTANSFGSGLGAANVLRVRGSQLIYESPSTPIDLGIQGDQVFLVLYGTGLRGVDKSKVRVYLGGTQLTVDFVGAAPGFEGLEQINVPLPAGLAGRGLLDLLVYADGWTANTIQFNIK